MAESTLVERFAREHFTLDSITERRQGQVLAALARYQRTLEVPIEQAGDIELRAWMVALREEGLAVSTIRLHRACVMSFYNWCFRTHEIELEQIWRLRGVRAPRGSGQSVPRPYSGKELARMWAELDAAFPLLSPERETRLLKRLAKGTARVQGPLRRHVWRCQLDAILELALVCGLRRVEIYRLSLDDCHWDNKYIVVHGKRTDQRDKVREVPYPDSTRAAVRRWYRLRGLMSPQPGLPIWLAVLRDPPARGLSWERMAEILHSFGDWQLHRLRHTCATERLRAGMKLEELRDFLGHSDINQTLAYAQLVRSDIHKASERVDRAFQRAIRAA